MSQAVVVLKKGEGRYLKSGGLWVYDNEIESIMGSAEDGDIVLVHDFDGYPMGSGFINRKSKITVRMLSRSKDQIIDEEFIKLRVKNAWEYRKTVMLDEKDLNCCRVIFGEADFLPGLVVDKYADILVVESLALGIDRLKVQILSELIKLLKEDGYDIRGIYERSDAPVRKKEGMRPFKGWIYQKDAGFKENISNDSDSMPAMDPHVEIVENGVRYLVDVENGQKTGFFLDQKYNRLAMHRICRDKRVLDCFTHMGTFALNAGIAGASEVTGLDISDFAVAQATENAKRNNLQDTVKFRQADVLDELPKLIEAGEKYDVVILDPPAFTKSREATKNAIKGYREINMKGLKLIKDGGYLATCSCSHFMTEELFKKTIAQAAQSAHKRLRQVEFRTQAADHPILWSAEDSYYLKFLIFQVVDEK